MNLISLLQDMVKIESVTGRENELCHFLKEILEEFSEVELQKVGNRFNLIAMRGDAEILLLGHLDTVPIGEGWKFKQGEIVDKKLYGRGSSDMKAGLFSMIEAFRVSENVCFAAVVGEESGGEGAEELNKAMRFKFGIVGEPTDLNLAIVEKGIVTFEVETWGKACHSSRPWDGVNAIHIMSEVVERLKNFEFKNSHPLLGNSTMQVTGIEGGVAHNVIPDKCIATVNLRVIPEDENIFEEIEKSFKDCRVKKILFGKPYEISKKNKYVELLNKISGGEFMGMHGATDARLLETPCVIFGPGNLEVSHQIDEYVELEKVVRGTEILKKFLKEVSRL